MSNIKHSGIWQITERFIEDKLPDAVSLIYGTFIILKFMQRIIFRLLILT